MYRPFPPADYVEGGRHIQTEIGARDRHKFYQRPQLPVMGTTAPQFTPQRAPTIVPQSIHQLQEREKLKKQAAAAAASTPNGTAAPRRPPGARVGTMAGRDAAMQNLSPTIHHHGGHLVRSVVCQTDMRENEAQTDPYTPDYYVEEGKNPEVLAIMSLKYGDGLPAKKPEIEMIDRVRRRREVEESLPQGADEASMQKRLQMLEELESAEWQERDEHIKALQESKLAGIHQAMRKREREREENSAARVNAVAEKAIQAYTEKMEKLQRKRFKQTRQLGETHADPMATVQPKKPDRIEGYATHGPRGKAVETKSLIEKPKSKFYDARPTLLSFPEGVQELERTEGRRVDRVRKGDLQAPEDITLSECKTKYQQRKVKQVAADLEYANATIQKAKQGPLGTTSIQDLYRATPRLIRPDTPTLVLEGDDEEEMEEALILLQRLMRGRAVQNDFFEGKERCHGLIEELQAAQKAKESERKYLKKEDEEREQKRKEDIVNGVLDSIQGDVVHTTLDYLAKELLRQRQAALFDRLREEALATRQRREEAERQRRVAEEPLRLLADERYRQIVQTTEYTIHTYLTGIVEESVGETAHRAAFEEQLQIIDLEAEEERKQQERAAEEDRSPDQIREKTICDLLKSFVMPQVAKDLKAIDERR